MKKGIVVLAMALLFGVGCASVEYRNGRENVEMGQVDAFKVYPMQAGIEVGEKISGVAECERWFGFFYKKPDKQTFGVGLQYGAGNFAPDECTRGAIYDALTRAQADTIVAPQYTAVKKKDLCLFGIKSLCLHVVDQIMVTGYKGTFKNIQPMPKELVNFKWKAEALKN